jgi:hypothetical protein
MNSHDEFDESDADGHSGGASARSGAFDFVRRMAAAGLGAIFLSEEGLRKLASQLKLPKEALALFLNQAEKAKDDIGKLLSDEVRKFLQSERLRDELLKSIAGMTLEVRAEVKLVPDRVRDEVSSLLPKVKINDLKVVTSDEQASRGKERRKKKS